MPCALCIARGSVIKQDVAKVKRRLLLLVASSVNLGSGLLKMRARSPLICGFLGSVPGIPARPGVHNSETIDIERLPL
jgi:hypothetical protein